jgi:tripartite-type tricarboxylate transporter receptor subunit TctC
VRSLAARGLVAFMVGATLVACARAPQAAAPAPAPPSSAGAPAAAAADDRAVADFYQGKNLRLVVPYTAGGAFDVLARMLARVLPQYIPGRPNIVVENKTGAAGLLALNTVYAVEPKDGTVVVMPGENLVLLQAVGAPGVEFDARKMSWLASATRSPYACLVRLDTGVTSIQDVIDGKEVAIAGTSPGTALHDTAAIINGTLGTNFKLVPGYGGAADMRLALDKKESTAPATTWSR